MIENLKKYLNYVWDKIKSNKNLVIIILAALLIWRILKNNLILILALGYLIWISQQGSLINQVSQEQEQEMAMGVENFDKTGTVFADVGEPKFDLMGERIFLHPPNYDIPQYPCCAFQDRLI